MVVAIVPARAQDTAQAPELQPPPIPTSAAGSGEQPPEEKATDQADAPANSGGSPNSMDSLLNMAEQDVGALGSVKVREDASADLGGMPQSALDPRELSSASSSNTTGELLSNAPSVFLRRTSALNLDARVRGYSGSQLVATADGATQVKTRLDIDSVFSQIDPNLVQGLNVIDGPYAVEYGPGFAFLTADLLAPGRSQLFESQFTTLFGANNNGGQVMWRQGARASHRDWGALVSVGQRLGSDYRPGGGGADFDVPASYQVEDAFTSLSGDLNAATRLDFTYLHQSLHDVELPGVAYDINGSGSDQFNVRLAMRDTDDRPDRFVTQFWWNQTAYNGDSFHESKQRTFVTRLLGEPEPDLVGGSLQSGGLSDSWGARSAWLLGDPDAVALKVGADWRRVRQFYRERDFQSDGSPAFNGDVFGLPDSSQDDVGLFASLLFRPGQRWRVSLGERLDWVQYSLNANDEVILTTQETPDGTYFPQTATPSSSLNMTFITAEYDLNDHWVASCGSAYAMRPPNLAELYSDQPYVPLVRFGNSFSLGRSNLEDEQNWQIDFGLTGRWERGTLGARFYHSQVRNYIGLSPINFGTFPDLVVSPTSALGRGRAYMVEPGAVGIDLNADTASIAYMYRNLDRVVFTGGEMFGDYRLAPWCELTGFVAYTRGTNEDPRSFDTTTGQTTVLANSDPLWGVFPLNSTCGLKLIEPRFRRFSIELQPRFAHSQRRVAGTLGEVGTSGYSVWNLYGVYTPSPRLTLRTSLLNVFDKLYTEHGSLAVVDRNGAISFVKEPGLSWFSSVEYRW